MSLNHLAALAALAERCAVDLEPDVERYTALVRRTLKSGGTLFFAGNGGSAAHAQHIVTEYVVRYGKVNRPAARALALSTDTSLLTAAANDLGFEAIFARQIEAHGRAGDLLVVISTSGASPNCLRAAEAARAAGLATVGLLGGDGGKLKGLVDVAMVVPSDDTALVQEVQLAIDHHVCSVIEKEMVAGGW
jgi:D-sedoheptulose 7-phosphate isomerase